MEQSYYNESDIFADSRAHDSAGTYVVLKYSTIHDLLKSLEVLTFDSEADVARYLLPRLMGYSYNDEHLTFRHRISQNGVAYHNSYKLFNRDCYTSIREEMLRAS